MNNERRHIACAALADYHVNSFALTYNLNPEDLLSDWNLWYDQYEAMDDKELYDSIYKMHAAIDMQSRVISKWPSEVYEEII